MTTISPERFSVSTSPAIILQFLRKNGCKDLTHQLDTSVILDHPIARGGYNDIYEARLHNGRVSVARIPSSDFDTDIHSDNLWAAREIYAWSKCNHPNVLPLLGFAYSQNLLALLLPGMRNGGLPKYLRRNPNVDRNSMCLQVCNGLKYLHQTGIVHGNLKASSILVSNQGAPLISISVVATSGSLMDFDCHRDIRLNLQWAAPELLTGANPLETEQTDVYALGMTFLEIITDEVPFEGVSDSRLLYRLAARNEIPDRPTAYLPTGEPVGDRLWALLVRCWNRDPYIRPQMPLVCQMMKRYVRMADAGISGASQGVLRALETGSETVTSLMTITEVIRRLHEHGCQSIDEELDINSCSSRPRSQGGFGDVYRGLLKDGTPVAIKTVRIHITDDKKGHRDLKRAARELYIWSKCDHPHVLPLLGLVEFRNMIGMVSKWVEGGNLTSYVANSPNIDRYGLSADIADGLRYLHSEGITHGDLKGPNVLVSQYGTPLITDFGNAVFQEGTLNFTSTTQHNNYTLRYTAPELLDGRLNTCSFAADVYALGMTILEIFTSRPPYSGISDHRVLMLVAGEKVKPARPEENIRLDNDQDNRLWSLLSKCWDNRPENRPSSAGVQEAIYEIMDT